MRKTIYRYDFNTHLFRNTCSPSRASILIVVQLGLLSREGTAGGEGKKEMEARCRDEPYRPYGTGRLTGGSVNGGRGAWADRVQQRLVIREAQRRRPEVNLRRLVLVKHMYKVQSGEAVALVQLRPVELESCCAPARLSRSGCRNLAPGTRRRKAGMARW